MPRRVRHYLLQQFDRTFCILPSLVVWIRFLPPSIRLALNGTGCLQLCRCFHQCLPMRAFPSHACLQKGKGANAAAKRSLSDAEVQTLMVRVGDADV